MSAFDPDFPLDTVLTHDRAWLCNKRQQITQRLSKGLPCSKLIEAFQRRLQQSQRQFHEKQLSMPKVDYPTDLPITEHIEAIKSLISQHQVIILSGETGSGKTTQLPKICLELGRGLSGRIGHTQPRKIAARSIAQRLSEELKVELGQTVGYQVRFQDHCNDNTLIKVMTDGILLSELEHDKKLLQYDTLIIDEAHERSLNIDFLLGYLRCILDSRPDLKVIITSATIDVERFSKHFNNAPIIEIPGRSYPVQTLYWPAQELTSDNENNLSEAIVQSIRDLISRERQGLGHRHGDILVFLSGEREIREASKAIREAKIEQCEVLPLYARLIKSEQQRIFHPPKNGLRRIILSTNVAETSLTVPRIHYVIDTGKARVSRYCHRSKIQRLPTESISKASAEQRKGRCGRVSDGTCIRLYSEADFESRSAFTLPEILRTNLAAVILNMLSLKIGDIEKFPFIEAPSPRMIKDGFVLLEHIGAIDDERQITPIGRQISKLPIDPRLGRMLVAANQHRCLSELLIIASGLCVQDPREYPVNKRPQAEQAHAAYANSQSDFMSLLQLWHHHESMYQNLTKSAIKKRCKKEYLSSVRMQEWRDIHHQLKTAARALQFRLNDNSADYASIHQSLLSGLLNNMGQKIENRTYLGARNKQFNIFPGSSVGKKSPQWVMAAELIETSKLYAHHCAAIEPEWALDYASKLIKHHYSEPHYSAKSGGVMAYLKITLFGLTLVDKKRINYSKIEPALCRELFIREALVNEQYAKNRYNLPKFWRHNQAIIQSILEMEAKSRRRDILIDEQQSFAFYDEIIPQHIVDVKGFDKWRKEIERSEPTVLYLSEQELMRHGANKVSAEQFPNKITWQDMQFPLKYEFSPGKEHDGVTATIHLSQLNRVPQSLFEWLVPGLLHEKCVELTKSLPKAIRKQLVPIPSAVTTALTGIEAQDRPLHEVLSHQFKKYFAVEITEDAWDRNKIDNYYLMNFNVVDEDGRSLSISRDIEALQAELQPKLQHNLNTHSKRLAYEEKRFSGWDFDEIEATYSFEKNGLKMTAYPALIDDDDGVEIKLIDTPEEAHALTKMGVTRLIALSLSQEVKKLEKNLFQEKSKKLLLAKYFDSKSVIKEIIDAIILHTFLSQELPRTRAAFEQCIARGQGNLFSVAQRYETIVSSMLLHRMQCDKQIQSTAPSLAYAKEDCHDQLSLLFNKHFLRTPLMQLQRCPRYIQAITIRLEKISNNPQKDKANTALIQKLQTKISRDFNGNIPVFDASSAYYQYRWMIEEFRISLFAQTLKTFEPVSQKKLEKIWQQVESEKNKLNPRAGQ